MTTKQGVDAARVRDRRKSELCREAIKPPTVEQMRELTEERDAARTATAELAEFCQQALATVAAVKAAYAAYEAALGRREHGGVAAGRLVDAVSAALNASEIRMAVSA